MSRKLYTNDDVLATILSFASFITATYGLYATLPDNRKVILQADPEALVRARKL